MPAKSPCRVGAGVLLSAMVLTACGGPSLRTVKPRSVEKANPAPVNASPSSSSSTGPDAEAQKNVLSTYFSFMGDWNMAAFNPADQGTKLSNHATGQALKLITANVQRARREGTIGKGPLQFAPTVSHLDLHSQPATAFIDDCVDATKYLKYSASDGSLVGTPDTDTRLQHVTAHLVAVGGSWKVDELHIYQPGSCR